MKKTRKLNKWQSFKNERIYRIKDLGRPAIFLLPLNKLKKKIKGITIENRLHGFLLNNFDSYTTSVVPNFGFWRNDSKKIVHDKCREYEVSFSGKKNMPILLAELSEISGLIGEECVYFKAGQYSCLIFPV